MRPEPAAPRRASPPWVLLPAVAVALCAAATPGLAQEEAPTPAPQAAEPTPSPEPTPEAPAEALRAVSGSARARYLLRAGADASDQDLYGDLRVSVEPLSHPRLSAMAFGRVALDADGAEAEGAPQVFGNLEDRNDTALDPRLYEAHVDAARLGPVALVRAGRQMSWDGPLFLYFDGLRAESRAFSAAGDLSFGIQGGIPVHRFEVDRAGDLLAGAWVGARPWQGGRVEVWGLHVKDAATTGDLAEDVLATTVWQAVGQGVRLRATHTLVDGGHRSVEALASYTLADQDLWVQARVYDQLRTLTVEPLELDQLTSSLQDVYPYWQAHLAAAKGLGAHLSVDAGASLRRLRYAELASMYNHDVFQAWAAATGRDLGVPGLSLTLSGSAWDAFTGEDLILAGGAEVGYRRERRLSAAAGTSWALYLYDRYADIELSEVRTWYARGRARLPGGLRGELGYALEDATQGRFHVFNLSVGYDL